jgi:hypothetical protein
MTTKIIAVLMGGSALILAPAPVFAQEAPAPAPAPTPAPDTAPAPEAAKSIDIPGASSANHLVYTPADLARFAPKNALDMLNQVPGFSINQGDEMRGLGQANVNVLINGERLALKSESIFDRLQKISIDKVVRIEIVDGASLKIPGLSGQVANIVTSGGGMSGQFEWSPRFRFGYVRPRWFGGSVSINGSAGKLDYSLAVANPGGTGATKGPTEITDANGTLTEHRYSHLSVMNNFPKVSGTLKWDGPGSSVANFNASYQRGYFDLHDREDRTRPDGHDSHKEYDPHERSYNYEIGGDFEFALGPGRLKLIGLERYEHSRYREDFVLTPADGSPATGSRYASVSSSGEHIGRGEYSWKMLGGDWQLSAEAAFNRYNGEAQLFDLDPTGDFIEIPFPSGTGGVTEDRYESILTHGRQLAKNLSLQIGAGAEYSKISQTGSMGLTRTFWRPKGSASLAWTPLKGLDVSVKLARVVGQLSFSDFLGRVNLDQGNGSAGNAALVPPQSWQLNFEVKENLGKWGSTTLKLYGQWYDDYIDWVIFPGTNPGELVEARGNIDKARLYGVDWTSTFNFDPIGFKGAKLDLHVNIDRPSIIDPVSHTRRRFSGWNDTYISGDFRHDIPGSDWAWGMGFQKYHANPYFRLREVGLDYEGPVYTSAFIENKDVFGMTLRLNAFNLTNGHHIVHRTVYDGYRGSSGVLFHEDTREKVGLIYSVSLKGKF